MTTKEEQEERDFVHTVEVLLASAAAERELTSASRGLSGQWRTSLPSGQPAAYRRWPAVAAGILAILGGTYASHEYSRWQFEEERGRQEAEVKGVAKERQELRIAEEHAGGNAERLAYVEAKRQAEAAAASKKAEGEATARARADEEVRRVAEAAAVEKRAAEERARQEVEAKRLAAVVAEVSGEEERARQEAEAKRLAEAPKKEADQEAEAKHAEEGRVAIAKIADEEAARRQAEQRVAATVLNAEERVMFIKRIQEVLKQSKCYAGAINGSSDDAQKSLDRYVKSARLQGKDKPAHIELAKATAGDFDSWLKEADDIKGGLCSFPLERAENKPIASKPQHREEPRRAHAAEPRSRPSSGAGGGGGSGPIQGLR